MTSPIGSVIAHTIVISRAGPTEAARVRGQRESHHASQARTAVSVQALARPPQVNRAGPSTSSRWDATSMAMSSASSAAIVAGVVRSRSQRGHRPVAARVPSWSQRPRLLAKSAASVLVIAAAYL